MVQNIDLAPTFLDVAHVPAPKDLQGMSLMPLLSGTIKKFSRPSLYYRYYEFPDPHHVYPHLGIRQQRYKLIYFYSINEWELYDLKQDPDEQNNLSKNPRYQKLFNTMKEELIERKNFYKDEETAGVVK